jgi:hypothetical protein
MPETRRVALALFMAVLVPLAGLAKFDSKRAPFELRLRTVVHSFEPASVFALPGERLHIGVVSSSSVTPNFELDVPSGVVKRLAPKEFEWEAPAEFGIHQIEISNPAYENDFDLNVIVLEPLARVVNGSLNGYRIGNYPARPLKNNPIYERPKGFIAVTKQNADTHVTPHFKLKQFICKQQEGYPHYLVLNEELLLKLELILERLNELGYKADTLHVMSGYRTPYYNKAIGNVEYSLHQYGRAADIFVDDDGNDVMDDLTKDGKVDLKDAVRLRDIIQQLFAEKRYAHLAGGVGLYNANAAHGPFVHIDARGYSAKW